MSAGFIEGLLVGSVGVGICVSVACSREIDRLSREARRLYGELATAREAQVRRVAAEPEFVAGVEAARAAFAAGHSDPVSADEFAAKFAEVERINAVKDRILANSECLHCGGAGWSGGENCGYCNADSAKGERG